MRTDLHQHLWPPLFLEALRARRRPPRLRGWILELPDEPPYPIEPAAHDPELRAARAAADGDDLVCVATSAALGLDRLAPEQAAELAEAWLEGALALPPPFAAWATAGIRQPDPAALEAALDRGAIGLELAADVLAAPWALDRLAPLLGGARRPATARPPRARRDAGHRAPGVVGARRSLRRAAARGLVGVGRRRPRRASRACRCASPRSPAWARCTASATARAAAGTVRWTR